MNAMDAKAPLASMASTRLVQPTSANANPAGTPGIHSISGNSTACKGFGNAHAARKTLKLLKAGIPAKAWFFCRLP
jgi:hypothetical protein